MDTQYLLCIGKIIDAVRLDDKEKGMIYANFLCDNLERHGCKKSADYLRKHISGDLGQPVRLAETPRRDGVEGL